MLALCMKKIAFLHTAQVHVQTFTQLAQNLDVELQHVVKPELLARALSQGSPSVHDDTVEALAQLSNADAIICTCTSLGAIVDEYSQTLPQLFRIDRPLMEAALVHAPHIAVAICLESSRQSTLDLLESCAQKAGVKIQPRIILCADAWQYFESGDQAQFAQSIAGQIITETSQSTGCIILAQASMRVAAPLLANLGMPILSSPQLAIDAAVKNMAS